MKINIFAPFGSRSPEVGLIYLFANYMRERGVEVTQLRCNGMFSQCDRDGELGWKRTLSSCFTCVQEQKKLSTWGSIRSEDLSPFITPEEITTSVRWVNSLSADELMESTIDGEPIAQYMHGSIKARFGIPAIDPRNKNHETYARRLMLGTLRVLDASRRYCEQRPFDLAMVAGGDNFMVQGFLHEAQVAKLPCFIFRADFTKRCVHVINSADKATSYECPLMIDDIGALRAEVGSWGTDLIRLLDEVCAYMGIKVPQAAASAGR